MQCKYQTCSKFGVLVITPYTVLSIEVDKNSTRTPMPVCRSVLTAEDAVIM